MGSYSYDSWGKLLGATYATGVDVSSVYDILNKNPFRYRGYYYDQETGWYYLQSRYYDPEVKRFVNADWEMDSSHGPVGFNLYVYCVDNPINNSDPAGNNPVAITLEQWLLYLLQGLGAGASAIAPYAVGVGLGAFGVLAPYLASVSYAYQQSASGYVHSPNTVSPRAINSGMATSYQKVKAEARAKSKDEGKQYHVHHVVAKGAPAAQKGRDALERVGINVNSPDNLVILPASYHASMHTDVYHNYVSDTVDAATAGGKEGVQASLFKIKLELTARAGG